MSAPLRATHTVTRTARDTRRRVLVLSVDVTYQFSFCVSFAICNSLPSFSIRLSAARSLLHLQERLQLLELPKSAMLYTPAALELALRCPLTGALSSGGDDDKPEMAESTLVRSDGAASTDMMVDGSEARVRCFFDGRNSVEILQMLDLVNG